METDKKQGGGGTAAPVLDKADSGTDGGRGGIPRC